MTLSAIAYKGLQVLSDNGADPKVASTCTGAGGTLIQGNALAVADRLTVLEAEGQLLSGTGAPSVGTGSAGDFYIDTAASNLYGPKTTTWPSPISLIGPIGAGLTWLGAWSAGTYNEFDAVSNDGSSYIANKTTTNEPPHADWDLLVSKGDAGTNGLTLLSGTVDPTTEGVNGDFYINTATTKIFGPKATTWPAGVVYVGTNGTNGLTLLSGTSDPTTQGVNGDFYINTATTKIFGPKAAGTWPAGVVYVGATGAGVVSGGTVGQILEKVDGTNYNTRWADNVKTMILKIMA